MRKPYVSDYKYNGLDMNARQKEYERDLMLWEQTEALKEANELQKQAIIDTNDNIYDIESELPEEPIYNESEINTNNYTATNDLDAQVKLAQQLNINYLLIRKLYRAIENYKAKYTTLKQILTTWIEFRQNHYEYDYEAFLEEFNYDEIITNRYSDLNVEIIPNITGTKEDYETMIKKLIKTIMNDKGYKNEGQLKIIGL